MLVNENTSSEDCAGREGAAEAPPDCGEDWAGVEVAIPTEKNVFPCALVPVVVNENTWRVSDDDWAEAEAVDCTDLLDGVAKDGARVAWMTLVTSDPWLLVITVVKESTWAGADEAME